MKRLIAVITGALLCAPALAHEPVAGDLVVADAWVRGTVPGQRMTGLFMRIESKSGASLVSAEVPPTVAAVAEIHQSIREKDMARMQAVPHITIAPGRPVALEPGSYHVMLMDLKQPMREGEQVRVRLHFELGGHRHDVEVMAPVRKVGATSGGGAMAGHRAMPGGAMGGAMGNHGAKP